MSRVMLVCPEPLAHRQPAGIGIRFIEMSKVLHAAGHDISLLSPNDGPISPGTLAVDPSVESSSHYSRSFSSVLALPLGRDHATDCTCAGTSRVISAKSSGRRIGFDT